MNKILEYQNLDIELMKLKQSCVKSEDRENLNKLKKYIIDAQNKGFKLENDAKELFDDYTKLKKQYDANLSKVQKLTATDMSTIKLDEVDSFLSQINSLSNELFLMERNINIIITKIKNSLKDFDATKKNMIKAKEKYNECKSNCDSHVNSLTPKIEEINKKMKVLEKDIEPEILEKYKTMKADRLFPVFSRLDNGHCAACRVEIPTSKVNSLKSSGKIVCESCRRIILAEE